MGVYVFNWKVLKEYLEMDERNPASSHDFGKDIIPLLLDEGKKLMAHSFKGYWKDVGTIKSLWEANMDLLQEDNELNLYDRDWRIYSVNPNQPPQFISDDAIIKDSLINEGCVVEGTVDHSVLFHGVTIGRDAIVKNSVIMPGAVIGERAFIENCIVSNDVVVPINAFVRPIEDNEEIILVTDDYLRSREEV